MPIKTRDDWLQTGAHGTPFMDSTERLPSAAPLLDNDGFTLSDDAKTTCTESVNAQKVAAAEGATVRSGVYVLANTLLGAGMLGLPGAFKDCGYLVGGVLLLFFGCTAILGLHLLAESSAKVPRPATFYAVAEAAMPGLGLVIDLAIGIKCFGVATSYGQREPNSQFPGPARPTLRRRVWVRTSLQVPDRGGRRAAARDGGVRRARRPAESSGARACRSQHIRYMPCRATRLLSLSASSGR
jgi:hypothetical protein